MEVVSTELNKESGLGYFNFEVAGVFISIECTRFSKVADIRADDRPVASVTTRATGRMPEFNAPCNINWSAWGPCDLESAGKFHQALSVAMQIQRDGFETFMKAHQALEQ